MVNMREYQLNLALIIAIVGEWYKNSELGVLLCVWLMTRRDTHAMFYINMNIYRGKNPHL